MKTIILRTEKSSRWAAMVLAAIVAIVTSAVVANATQTITTPNAAFISYNLNPGADTSPITPATNRSVLVMGCCTYVSDESVGQVTLLHTPSRGMFWFGLEEQSPATITLGGPNSTAGTHIVFIDASHFV